MFVRIAALLVILQLTGGAQDKEKCSFKDIHYRLDLLNTSHKHLHQKIDKLSTSVDQQFMIQRNELRKVFGFLFATFNIAQTPYEEGPTFQATVNNQDLQSTSQLTQPNQFLESLLQSNSFKQNIATKPNDNLILSILKNQNLQPTTQPTKSNEGLLLSNSLNQNTPTHPLPTSQLAETNESTAKSALLSILMNQNFNSTSQLTQPTQSSENLIQSIFKHQNFKPTSQLAESSESATQSTEPNEGLHVSNTISQHFQKISLPIKVSESTTPSTQLSESTTQSTQLSESTTHLTQYSEIPFYEGITESTAFKKGLKSTTLPSDESTKQSTESVTQKLQFSGSTTQSINEIKQDIESTTQSTEFRESTSTQSVLVNQNLEPITNSTQDVLISTEFSQFRIEDAEESTSSDKTLAVVQPLKARKFAGPIGPQSNCSDALKRSGQTSGVYMIQILNSNLKPFDAPCFADGNNEKDIRIRADISNAWMIIQRRQDGSVNFNRTWTEYQQGFGDLKGEFFIGLDTLNAITQSKVHELWIQLESFEGIKRWAKYSSFKIADANNSYALDIGSYEGNAGNSLFGHFGAKFSTDDMDNDLDPNVHCAHIYGAWWHKNCFEGNLNGHYSNGVIWKHFSGYHKSLKYVQMAIRPIQFK